MKTIQILIMLTCIFFGLEVYGYVPEEEKDYKTFEVGGILYRYDYDEWGNLDTDYVIVSQAKSNNSFYSGTIEIPETIEYNGITSVVKSIDQKTFENCTLDKVILPATLESVSGFYYATVNEVIIPEGIKLIGRDAFSHCKNLKTVSIPSSVYCIDIYAFDNSEIEYLIIPEGVTHIEADAFTGCKKLKTVNLPSSITFIGGNTFFDSGIEEITIPEGIKTIHVSTFEGCKQLKTLHLPTSVIEIEEKAFYHSGIEEISLENVRYIGERAFAGTNIKSANLKSLNLSLINLYKKELSKGVFSSCKYLESIILPNSIIDIKGYAFSGCKNLKQISLPESLKTIGEGAFKGSGLIEIELPDCVTDIGNYAFSSCEDLTKIDMSKVEELSYIRDYVFYECKNLKEILFPKKISHIMYKVFDYCESLETLDFPSNVFFFGDDFQGNPRPPITYLTGLKTITLPVLCFVGTDKFPYDERPNPSPYFIADFKNSKNLTTIISKILDPTDIQLRRTKFNSETYEKATLRVPVGTADLYRQCEGWKEFKNIVEDPTIIGMLTGIDEVFATDNSLNAYYQNGQIRFESNDIAEVEIYDLAGKLVMQIISDNGVVDASYLEAGIYVARIATSSDITTLKFHTR